jgi:hypothetical protein
MIPGKRGAVSKVSLGEEITSKSLKKSANSDKALATELGEPASVRDNGAYRLLSIVSGWEPTDLLQRRFRQ